MKLNEVFDTTAHILWSHRDNTLVGDFELNSKKYRLLLEEGEWDLPSGKTKTFLNIAFVRVFENDGNEIERTSLTHDSPDASKVLGIIFNGIKEKAGDISKYDAVTFGAKKDEHERMRIYNKMIPLYLKSFGSVIRNVATPADGLLSILFKSDEDPSMKEFITFLKSRGKM
jgi:hypothetical protein